MSEQMLIYTDDTEASRCTVMLLRHRNIVFKEVNVAEDHKLIATLKAAGHTTLPVVIVGNDVWTGYRPDRIKALLPQSPSRVRRRNRSA